jgi:hypothetical protein
MGFFCSFRGGENCSFTSVKDGRINFRFADSTGGLPSRLSCDDTPVARNGMDRIESNSSSFE